MTITSCVPYRPSYSESKSRCGVFSSSLISFTGGYFFREPILGLRYIKTVPMTHVTSRRTSMYQHKLIRGFTSPATSQRHKQPRPSCIAPEMAISLSKVIAGKRILVPPPAVILEAMGCIEVNARPMISQRLLSSLLRTPPSLT